MSDWQISETTFDPQQLHSLETVFTSGNGYLGTRGTFEEGYPAAEPLTLVQGLFDAAPIVYTELVNVPNWLHLRILINGEYFRLDHGEILAYQRELDLATGTLTRTVRWRSPAGQTVELRFERFTSLADVHVLGLTCQFTSVDFTGTVEVRAGLPGHVDNAGQLHWEWREQGSLDEQSAYLTVATKESQLLLSEACHLSLEGVENPTYAFQNCFWTPTVVACIQVAPGQSFTAQKIVTLFTSRESEDVQTSALEELVRASAQGYAALSAANDAAWESEWEKCNICIEGDDEADLALRYSLFQLLIAAPRHDDRVSIAAKTLSGLGYHGHVFWDTEIFMLPFFIYTQPELARNMLLYRYHTLPGARRVAAAQGYAGALFAWESAATGDESTPRWVPTPEGELIRIWCGDIELHIVADVAYAVQHYWRVTGDDDFLRDYGAEILLETALFWASRVEWNAERAVYEINDVIGPDENHEHVDNNAFTNRMARWNLQTALDTWSWLRQHYPEKASALAEQLGLAEPQLAHWREVIERIYCSQDPQTGLIEQFEGFFDLIPVDLAAYESRETSMQALFGVAETQAYQVLKQADVLMLLYLLSAEYDSAIIKTNWDYYTPRTDLTYGSSLGPAIQATLAAQIGDVETAYEHFMLAARTDLEDVRGNAGEGIHGASAGGLWQAVIFGFGGVRVEEGRLVADPRLPSGWTRLKFRLQYQGEWYTFDLSA
ncbi:MAG: glycoside hydrolase family 65 protein [Chloroflexota bacterium]|nr:glycoside hydrolase family 65 protein [Chloroflexota bacterium]